MVALSRFDCLPAPTHQCHELPFPTCKRRVTVPEYAHLRLLTKSDAIAFEGLPDGAQQHRITEWFCEEFDGAFMAWTAMRTLASLYGGLVGYDAVSWYADAVQTGTDSTQTADYNRVLQAGDDPSHQGTANQHRAYHGRPKESGAKH